MVFKISDNEFDGKINVNKKVIVDCYADWCGPCRMLAPIIEEVSNQLTDFDFYKLNVDEAGDISRRYGIMSIPTILVFVNGKLDKQLIGFRDHDELIKNIEN